MAEPRRANDVVWRAPVERESEAEERERKRGFSDEERESI